MALDPALHSDAVAFINELNCLVGDGSTLAESIAYLLENSTIVQDCIPAMEVGIDLDGGPYSVELNTPNEGDITITDTTSNESATIELLVLLQSLIDNIDFSALEDEQCEAIFQCIIDNGTEEQFTAFIERVNWSQQSEAVCTGILQCIIENGFEIQFRELANILHIPLTEAECYESVSEAGTAVEEFFNGVDLAAGLATVGSATATGGAIDGAPVGFTGVINEGIEAVQVIPQSGPQVPVRVRYTFNVPVSLELHLASISGSEQVRFFTLPDSSVLTAAADFDGTFLYESGNQGMATADVFVFDSITELEFEMTNFGPGGLSMLFGIFINESTPAGTVLTYDVFSYYDGAEVKRFASLAGVLDDPAEVSDADIADWTLCPKPSPAKKIECFKNSIGVDQIQVFDNGGIPIDDATFEWIPDDDPEAQAIIIRFDEVNNPPTLNYDVTLNIFEDNVLVYTEVASVQGGGFNQGIFPGHSFEFGATYRFEMSTPAPSVTVFNAVNSPQPAPQATFVTDPGDGSVPMVEIVAPGSNTFFVRTLEDGTVSACDEDGETVDVDPSWIACNDVLSSGQLAVVRSLVKETSEADIEQVVVNTIIPGTNVECDVVTVEPLIAAAGTLADGTTYTVANAELFDSAEDGDIRFDQADGLLTINFSAPVDLLVTPTDEGDVLNPIIWQDLQNGQTSEIVSDGTAAYTPGAADAALSVSGGNATATLSNPAVRSADDWGVVEITDTTSLTVQANDAEAMRFRARTVRQENVCQLIAELMQANT